MNKIILILIFGLLIVSCNSIYNPKNCERFRCSYSYNNGTSGLIIEDMDTRCPVKNPDDLEQELVNGRCIGKRQPFLWEK